MVAWLVVLVAAAALLASNVKLVRAGERGVVFRLGKIVSTKEPGLHVLIPIVDRMVRVSLRPAVIDVPHLQATCRDNVSVKVSAGVRFRVADPVKALADVEDLESAAQQLTQTTLRRVVGTFELDDLLHHRHKVSEELQSRLAEQTDAWGVEVSEASVASVQLPE